MIGITLFKNIYDNKTNNSIVFESWKSFGNFLSKLKDVRLQSKHDAHLFTPAVYAPNTTRANANVTEWCGVAALDVDHLVMDGDLLEDKLREMFGEWEYICYSTASSKKDHPKFRLVFPLKCSVPAKDIKDFWYALNVEMGNMGDTQTKDLSRMYYIPAEYDGAYNFFFSNSGQHIDPYALIQTHPNEEARKKERWNAEIRMKQAKIRADNADNTGVRWSSYRDCQFVSRKMLDEYAAMAFNDGSGRYQYVYKMMAWIACAAVKANYPIHASEIAQLIREIDQANSNIYGNRMLEREAQSAVDFAYTTV